jgi:hypothetical protein
MGPSLRSFSIRVVSLVALFVLCGCVPPPKKAAPTASRREHRQLPVHSNKTSDHELSTAEKEQLFRDFERWRAANRQIELGAVPASQLVPEDDDPEKPAEWR